MYDASHPGMRAFWAQLISLFDRRPTAAILIPSLQSGEPVALYLYELSVTWGAASKLTVWQVRDPVARVSCPVESRQHGQRAFGLRDPRDINEFDPCRSKIGNFVVL